MAPQLQQRAPRRPTQEWAGRRRAEGGAELQSGPTDGAGVSGLLGGGVRRDGGA